MTELTDSQLIAMIKFHQKAAKAFRESKQWTKAEQALNAGDRLLKIADKRFKDAQAR